MSLEAPSEFRELALRRGMAEEAVRVQQATQLAEAGNYVGFPAVLKPVSGAASLGVKKVSSPKELREGYEEVLGELHPPGQAAAVRQRREVAWLKGAGELVSEGPAPTGSR